jgi:ABC-2 type transport system ATP-binding protein
MIEVRNVVKNYDTVKAVQNLSFTANPGEIFGLIGPNGAGKSTTIRMIMNIIAPDAGEILLNGHRLSEADKNHIGYLPEERGLYKKMKVGEILAFLAEIKGGDAAACRERADQWLRRFDIFEWKDHKIDELSKGMAQKVQFIGTVAHDPAVLLFDEPFSGLDPVSQDLLLAAMLELKQAGKTILFSTHIMDHAEKICQKILLINKSRELLSGNLADIKARYGSPTVRIEFDGNADFIQLLPYVKTTRPFPRAMDVELADIASSDRLYCDLAGKLKIRRFEILEPSLHSIFVQLVGNTDKEDQDA